MFSLLEIISIPIILICGFILFFIISLPFQIIASFTNPQNDLFKNKKSVSFTTSEVKHYHLSYQERNMKRKTYKQISKNARHYRQVDYLCHIMKDLKLD